MGIQAIVLPFAGGHLKLQVACLGLMMLQLRPSGGLYAIQRTVVVRQRKTVAFPMN